MLTKRIKAVIVSTLKLILNEHQNDQQTIIYINNYVCVCVCVCVCESYIVQGTPPTVTVRSEGRPVSRFRPVMVRDVPPALGPLSGDTPITNGS